MRFFSSLSVAFLFAALTLVPVLTIAQQQQWQDSQPSERQDELRASRIAVKFDECTSRTLSIELNVAGRTPKADLVEALKLFADYPALAFTPSHAERTSVGYTASTRDYCETAKCARDAGFNEIQVRLSRFKGVRLTCSPEAPPTSQQEQQDQPKRDDGGVTSGN